MTIHSRPLHEDELREADDRRRRERETAAQQRREDVYFEREEQERQPVTTTHRRAASRVVALFAFAIGLPFWLDGARYTRDGWIAFLNWLALRLGIPGQVPPLSWQVAIGAMIAMGLAYSYIEMGRQPFTLPPRAQFFRLAAWHIECSWQVWLVWIVLIVSDIGTTYAGIRQARPDELVVLQSIGATTVSAALYGFTITFVPDRLLRYGWRGIWGKSG